jgi:HAD superfamily hydrolase (TIGR01509 family)
MSSLIFDLDGVLWMSGNIHADCFKTIANGINLDFRDYDEISGFSTKKAWEYLLGKYDHNFVGDLQELIEKKQALFRQKTDNIEVRNEDLLEIIKAYPDKPLALVTGASRASVDLFLSKIDSRINFDVVISADSGYPSKPDPSPYLEAIRQLGVRPEKSYVFEDSESGLKSAMAARTTAIHVTNSPLSTCKKHIYRPGNLLMCVNSPREVVGQLQ